MSDDELRCRFGHATYAGYLCPYGHELVPAPEAVPEQVDVPRTACWKCDADAIHAANEDCHECHAPRVPPALYIEFPSGTVMLADRESATELGRAGEHGRVFAHHPNVSRRHATVSVDANGDTWLTPFPEAPNGTFVNDLEIMARTAIGPGDQIRFATNRGAAPGPVSDRIRQPSRER